MPGNAPSSRISTAAPPPARRPATLEKGEVVTEEGRKSYRYMKALPTQALCSSATAPRRASPPAVKEKLSALYPQDKAMGYSVGQIRGAMTIRKPL